MFENLNTKMTTSFNDYIAELKTNPWEIITMILDIIIVALLAYELIKFAKKTKVWQLLKGIVFLIIITFLSGLLKLRILNLLLTSIMTYGVIALLIIFQPELRRALEQIGSNTFSKFLGLDKNLKDKTKEDIYKVVIAVEELAKHKTGALIVFEREVKLEDIIETGILMDSIISPQVLVNIFVPNTPLHDGAVVISNNKISASACILPLADDKDIARELGTRHRAAIGISKETDAIAVVVSEETGKVSIAKDGTLIADLKEEALRKILIKYLVNARFSNDEKEKRMLKIKSKLDKRKKQIINKKEEKEEDKSNSEDNKNTKEKDLSKKKQKNNKKKESNNEKHQTNN